MAQDIIGEALPNRGAAALETLLEVAQATANQSLALANRIDHGLQDHVQDAAFNRALAFMKASAKVGMALAKLRGEHTSNLIVRRTQVAEEAVHVEFPAPELRLARKGPPKDLTPAMEERINKIYADWVIARAASHGDVKPWSGEIEDDAEGEGDPPRNFERSNAGK